MSWFPDGSTVSMGCDGRWAPGHCTGSVPVKLATPDTEQLGTALALLVDLVFGDETNQNLLTMRLDAWLRQRPPQLTDAQQRITSLVQHRIESLARAHHRQPRRLANHTASHGQPPRRPRNPSTRRRRRGARRSRHSLTDQ
jgi:hypothetical protein